ncbi:MAG: DUF2147 domain-containing protein [Bacteroidales bacterium]|nr:DUF2147 domain-containing protein [Bacteroidales bacterium]
MKASKLLLLFFIALPPMQAIVAQNSNADAICGTYRVESPVSNDIVKIKIYRTSNGKYQGKYVWLSQPNNPDGTPRTDINNPDPKKRNRTADQIVAVWNLTFDGKEWVDGLIYDPTSGKTYGLKGKVAKNKKDMEMRYYIKKPIIGLTSTWTREN